MTALTDGRLDEHGLRAALARTLDCPDFRIVVVNRQRLKRGVTRLELEVLGTRRSVIAKRLAPEVAVRNRLVVERWLPAEGMQSATAALLAVLPQPGFTWLVSEDLGRRTLESGASDPARVAAAVALVAQLHRRFVDHAVLGECRLWGGDLGMPYHDGNLRDAERAVSALRARRADEQATRELCERVLARLLRLRADARRRAEVMERCGGPETLLHGDLWRENLVEVPRGAGFELRLIDWDHAGVGPPIYDVSTFLYRFPPSERRTVWSAYRAAFGEGPWRFPDEAELALLCETVEHTRIANRLIWPALAALRGEYDSALEELATVESWFEDLAPLLP